MSPIFPRRVRVVFEERGVDLSYAADLAKRLNVYFTVFAPSYEKHVRKLSELMGVSYRDVSQELTHGRIDPVVARYASNIPLLGMGLITTMSERGNGEDDLLVSSDASRKFTTPTIIPAREQKVFRGAKGSIFVPIGDGPSGLVGLAKAIMLARRLNTSIHLWHTTWRDERRKDSNPENHLTLRSRGNIESARKMLESASIDFTTSIVCSPRLVEGLVGAALTSGSSLIVMAQGGHKEFGTYTDRVRARNCPIPLLYIPTTKVVA